MQSYQYPDISFIQFAKAAVAGMVKTRMIPALGEQGACRLHIALTAYVFSNLTNSQLAKTILYSDNPECPELKAIVSNQKIKQQYGDNLGARMANAFADQLTPSQLSDSTSYQTASAVILLGSDCPTITSEYLEQAITALMTTSDIVLGPANDGGYVLVGMRSPNPEIFEGIRWGSSEVLSQTLHIIKQRQLKYFLLPSLSDIDRPDDLPLLAPLGISLDA